MTRRWAVRIEPTEVESLKSLRLISGAEICELASEIWVRGPVLDDSLQRILRRHPHARRYRVLPDDQLVGPDKLVPLGYLPPGPWSPLQDYLPVALPVASFAGRVRERVPLRLVRTSAMRVANVLVTHMGAWGPYGVSAPLVRLDRWHFAAAADGRVVVRGHPLPPLAGEQYVEDTGIGVPVGWTWSPDVPVDVLRRLLQLRAYDLVLLRSDESGERIDGDCFVRAGRAAIRRTAREFEHG